MPGIVAIATRSGRAEAEADLRRMIDRLRHKPSYEVGIWCDEELGLYVGWTARGGSFAARMPVCNDRGDLVLIFSGEEYSSPETVGQFCRNGDRSSLEGPAYLAHFAETDPAFPANLNGRFHGILIDRSRQTATLFNDRFGLHRMYIHESGHGTYCAAEAKALLTVCPELRRVDPRSLGELISCGCVLENRSLFDGIKVLPPASNWTIQNGTITARRTYFDPAEWQFAEPLSPDAFYASLVCAFQECLPRYFQGPEHIGMSLTGGLDTRLIMAWRRFPERTLPCYSFGGTLRDSEDVRIARRIAQACGQTHEVIRVGKEFLSRFHDFAERAVYITDGCVHVTHAPDLYVNEIASAVAPVRMTGNYGGEVLRGIRAFKPVDTTPGLFTSDLLPQFLVARQTYTRSIATHPVTFAAFRQAPWHHYGLLALEQSQLSLRSPFLDNKLLRLLFRAPLSSLDGPALCLKLIRDADTRLHRIRTDRGLSGNGRGFRAYVSQQYLTLMAKAEYAYDYGMPQWVAKIDHVLAPLHLERLFLGRHKFYHFRVWYRDALQDYVRAMLLDDRSLSRPYLNRRMVEAVVTEHMCGTANHTTAIHKLLTLELIHRLFVDG